MKEGKIIVKKYLIFIFLSLLFTGYANELYRDSTTSLILEEVSESEFKIIFDDSIEKIEYYEISHVKYNYKWLSEDVLRIDFGSSFAPDVRSYFFSRKRNKISKHKNFIKRK